MTFSDGKLLGTDVEVISRRDVGDIQYVLSESIHGFVVSGVSKSTKEIILAVPMDGMDEAIERFRKEITK